MIRKILQTLHDPKNIVKNIVTLHDPKNIVKNIVNPT